MPKGSTNQNTNGHGKTLRIAPDRVGPSAGATDMTIEMRPMIRPRSLGGTSVSTVVMSRGIITAVPLAWITRAMTSTPKFGASAASRVPAVNSDIARMYTVRVLRRCSRNPVIGMTTAIVSRNAVVSHCPVAGSMPRSAMMSGSATFITVSLRNTTNAETSSRPITTVLRREWSTGCAAEVTSSAVSIVF